LPTLPLYFYGSYPALSGIIYAIQKEIASLKIMVAPSDQKAAVIKSYKYEKI